MSTESRIAELEERVILMEKKIDVLLHHFNQLATELVVSGEAKFGNIIHPDELDK